jgi:hypothetical protein
MGWWDKNSHYGSHWAMRRAVHDGLERSGHKEEEFKSFNEEDEHLYFFPVSVNRQSIRSLISQVA